MFFCNWQMICNLQIWYFIAMLDDWRVVRIVTYTRFYGLLIVAGCCLCSLTGAAGFQQEFSGDSTNVTRDCSWFIFKSGWSIIMDVTPLGVFQSHGTICPVWWSPGFCSVVPMLLIRSFHLLNSWELYMTWQYNNQAISRKLSTMTFGNGLLVDFALATSQNQPTECEVISVCTCCILFWSVGPLVSWLVGQVHETNNNRDAVTRLLVCWFSVRLVNIPTNKPSLYKQLISILESQYI